LINLPVFPKAAAFNARAARREAALDFSEEDINPRETEMGYRWKVSIFLQNIFLILFFSQPMVLPFLMLVLSHKMLVKKNSMLEKKN